jgi:hypothetical protein
VKNAKREAIRPPVSRLSGRRDSNPRHSPWQGDTLPLSYARNCHPVVAHGSGKIAGFEASASGLMHLNRSLHRNSCATGKGCAFAPLRGTCVRTESALRRYQLRMTAAPAIEPPRIFAPKCKSPSASGYSGFSTTAIAAHSPHQTAAPSLPKTSAAMRNTPQLAQRVMSSVTAVGSM